MNFNDPYCNEEVKQECEPMKLNMSSMLEGMGKTENRPLIARINELELALEKASKALQEVYSRLNKIDIILGA